MKPILIAFIVILTTALTFSEYTNYIVDVKYEESGITLSLPLDESGHAKRDYDCFLSYPASFETEPSFRIDEWEKRGLGLFADIAATNIGSDIEITAVIEEASMAGWKDGTIGDRVIRMPMFRSSGVNVTIEVVPDMWISFDVMDMRLRELIPNHGLESTGAPPAAETPETHP